MHPFLQSEVRPISIVVCSREEEYKYYDTKLILNGSITLKPLTYFQIRSYLNSIDKNNLWKTVAPHDEILNLLSIPLFLSIAVLAEDELSVQEWRKEKTEKRRLNYLLNAYVRQMLTRKTNSYSYKNKLPNIEISKSWLIWLSKCLKKQFKTEFLIEELQPYILVREQKQIYIRHCRNLGNLSYAIPGLLFFIHLLGICITLFSGIGAIGFFLSIILAIIGANILRCQWIEFLTRDEPINFKAAENLIWSLEKAKMLILKDKDALIGKLLALFSIPAFSFFTGSPLQGFGTSILLAILHIYFAGISEGLEIKSKVIPNEGILKEYNRFRSNCINFYLFSLIIFTFFIYLTSTEKVIFLRILTSFFLSFLINIPIICLLVIPLFFVWVLFGAGKPCIQHFFLRYTLFKSGNIPWNYARFLDYATELLLLQRIGGSYRFIHRTLRDHFAEMPLEND